MLLGKFWDITIARPLTASFRMLINSLSSCWTSWARCISLRRKQACAILMLAICISPYVVFWKNWLIFGKLWMLCQPDMSQFILSTGIIYLYIYIYFCGATTHNRPMASLVRFLDSTQLHTPTRYVSSKWVISLLQRPLPMQHLTNTKDEQLCPQWVWTCNPSNELPADLRLRLRAEYYIQSSGSCSIAEIYK